MLESKLSSPLEQAIGGEALERYERALSAPEAGRTERDHRPRGAGLHLRGAGGGARQTHAEAARKAAQRALVRLVEEMDRGQK